MTISILVSDKSGSAIGEIPIATSQVFMEKWIVLSRRLGLKIVPTLNSGNVHFDGQTIHLLLDELRAMERAIAKLQDEGYSSIGERLKYIVREVESSIVTDNVSYDVG